MKRLLAKTTLVITLLATSNFTFAQKFQKSIEHCEQKHKELTELSMCFDRLRASKDRELQTWINNQVFILEELALKSGRRSALEMFKRSQRNFITFRENNCRWQYLHISPDESAQLAYKKCYVLVTNQRIKELSLLGN